MSWFQEVPTRSLEMIEALGIHTDDPVIDVGGGASTLTDRLVEKGFGDITVLDVAAEALDASRRRLDGTAAVTWLHDDVLSWEPRRRFGLWHDRAVFHFLTDESDRARYLTTLASALRCAGALVLATFAADGPERCSGLPVARYSAAELSEAIGPSFEVVRQGRERHATPSGAVQPFVWLAARRRSD
ncbi:MAG: class I SAM-dependent methyltransferase [Acidimicrobiales bacterium]